MNHRDITRFRDRALFARRNREKAMLSPDDLDALLDLVLAQIEGDES